MFRNSIYRSLASFLLLLLFVLPMGMKEAHLLLEQHEHSPVCDAKAGDQHLHGQEFRHHDCAICLIHYAQFLSGEKSFSPPRLLEVGQAVTPDYRFPYTHPILSHIRERGPPSSTICA
ncbi:MAG: hypothetical protein KDD02_05365 [Phaeodactylibacter sp.]|nr:hypothetical protein [Phaeodactylibacter sp.]MCB9299833.1 hypothetical protein [Lewinellaceae bacterium]